jgi:pimeloyl-ACP methyl ester carboxylesterase
MARILLIHGAFSRASVWDRAAPGLRAASHTVETVDLPGAGADRTPVAEVTLDAYAQRVCEALAEGPPAVLVAHSMGGMAVTQAAARSPEHVAALVYVAAFLPADGQSLIDLTALPEGAGDQVQANLVVDGDPPVATMPIDTTRHALFGSCNDEQWAWGVERMEPQPVVPFTQPFRIDDAGSDGFSALPRAYIICSQDRAIPPALQRRMSQAAGCDPVIELDTDHCPWISRTDELVAALVEVAR